MSGLTTQHFRANVGIVVLDDGGRVLSLERSDVAGSWQLPQGGIDLGEEPAEAAVRELREETGIDPATVEPAGEYPDWLAYEWPREMQRNGRRGQVQRWFAFRATPATVLDLTHSAEFVAWRYEPLADLAQTVVPMRRAVYATLVPWVAALAQRNDG